MDEIYSLKARIAELEKANKELDDIFNAMDDSVFVIGNDNIITRANSACTFLLKIKSQDIIGKKCYEVVHKLNKPWPVCPFEKTKQDKKAHTEEVSDPNVGLTLLITTSPIFNENGEMSGAVHVAKDITGYEKQEEALAKKVRDLEIFYKATIDREMKIKELKKKVQELESKIRG